MDDIVDSYERYGHGENCECAECIAHDWEDCPCEDCYERRVIEADRARADYIWEANQTANERMGNLMGFEEEESN